MKLDSKKLFYSIGEVAELFNVNTSLIRFWEKEFTFIRPKKNTKGNRIYSPKDIQNLELIYRLVKTKGYTLEGAKKQLKENKKEVMMEADLQDKLLSIKARLEHLKDQLK